MLKESVKQVLYDRFMLIKGDLEWKKKKNGREVWF